MTRELLQLKPTPKSFTIIWRQYESILRNHKQYDTEEADDIIIPKYELYKLIALAYGIIDTMLLVASSYPDVKCLPDNMCLAINYVYLRLDEIMFKVDMMNDLTYSEVEQIRLLKEYDRQVIDATNSWFVLFNSELDIRGM